MGRHQGVAARLLSVLAAVSATALAAGCDAGGTTTVSGQGTPIRYLALGDSYTIGTSVTASENFPTALAGKLRQLTGRPVSITNLGVNGYTTRDLIRDELPRARPGDFDVVTVLIGVNDFVQGVPIAQYRTRLGEIYDTLTALNLPHGRLVAVSVPDFSFTPAGASFGRPAEIMTGIQEVNRVGAEVAAQHGIPFVDVFDVSRSGLDRPSWIAADGLHPGHQQYLAWADRIWEADLKAAAAGFVTN